MRILSDFASLGVPPGPRDLPGRPWPPPEAPGPIFYDFGVFPGALLEAFWGPWARFGSIFATLGTQKEQKSSFRAPRVAPKGFWQRKGTDQDFLHVAKT